MKKLAFFSTPCNYIDDVLTVVKEEKYVEWNLNTIPFSIDMKRMTDVRDLISKYGEVRYHLPYSFWDLGSSNITISNDSHSYYCRLFEMINFLGSDVAVIHIGYSMDANAEMSLKRLENLAKESEKYNIKLCVENLVKGPSSDISFIKKCLDIDNVYFCLDIGHAEFLKKKGKNNIYEEISSIKDKIIHAHVYYVEDSNMNHVPFNKKTILNNKWIDLLCDTDCTWYTMELDSKKDQGSQKRLLEDYLKHRKTA